jgi:hypothetical protein
MTSLASAFSTDDEASESISRCQCYHTFSFVTVGGVTKLVFMSLPWLHSTFLPCASLTMKSCSILVTRLKVLLSPTAGGLDAFHRMFGRDDLASKISSTAKTSVSGRSVMRALGLKVIIILNTLPNHFFLYLAPIHVVISAKTFHRKR